MTGRRRQHHVNRKVREIFRALEFEKNYTKQEILELYLNTIYLGKGCYGVQTAAEYYFGKDVSELDRGGMRQPHRHHQQPLPVWSHVHHHHHPGGRQHRHAPGAEQGAPGDDPDPDGRR